MKYADLKEAAEAIIQEELTELVTGDLVDRLKEVQHLERALARAKAQLEEFLDSEVDDTEL